MLPPREADQTFPIAYQYWVSTLAFGDAPVSGFGAFATEKSSVHRFAEVTLTRR